MKSYARRNALIPRGAGPVAVGVVIFALLVLAIRVVAPDALVKVANPLWQLGSALSGATSDAAASLSSPVALSKQLAAANEQDSELANENAKLAAQVADLTKLLGNRATAPPGILAGVLARPPESPYDSLLVDEGSAAGVVVGDAANGPGGVALGTVASVTTDSARITLYSAPGVSTDAWVGTGRIPVTLIGDGAGAFAATASKDASTTVGDLVYVAGPGSIPVGAVARIDSDPSSPTVTLRIQAIANPFTLSWITIARPL